MREANQRMPEHGREDRQQKRADAEELQSQVGNESPDHADPVAGGVGAGQDRGAVQRGIERRIRREREEEEERRDAQQETDQLIQPPVARGDKNAFQKTHVGRCYTVNVPWRKSARASSLCQEAGVAAMAELGGSVQLSSRGHLRLKEREGHGFSRAAGASKDEGFSPEELLRVTIYLTYHRMPLVRSLGRELWEVRSSLPHGRISRVIFCVEQAVRCCCTAL